jgi:hypothetical protein
VPIWIISAWESTHQSQAMPHAAPDLLVLLWGQWESSIVGKTNFQSMGSVKACSSSIEMKNQVEDKSLFTWHHIDCSKELTKQAEQFHWEKKKKKAAKDFCFRSWRIIDD